MRLTRQRRCLFLLFAIISFALTGPVFGDTGERAVTATVKPEHIEIGAHYDGMQLLVEGTAPAGSQVIVRFTGEPTELHLREKGKIFGLLWMNVGTVKVDNAPAVCIVGTSAYLAEIGEVARPYTLEGVMQMIEVEESGEENGIDIGNELLRLKTSEHLFSQNENLVELGADSAGSRSYSVRLAIPSALAPGKYHVEVVAVRDGRLLGEARSDVNASMVGFPAWLSSLAFDRSLLYGVMATIIAIVSGLAIGLVFQGKGGAH